LTCNTPRPAALAACAFLGLLVGILSELSHRRAALDVLLPLPSLLAELTKHPDRVLVAHYFNPPHLLPLVELVRSPHTSDATVATPQLLTRLGKRSAVIQKEVPVSAAAGLAARSALDRGAGRRDPLRTSTIIKAGFGRRLAAAGVFEIFEIAGWDLFLAVAEQLQPSINSSPEDSPLVRERVALNQRGLKDGQGFYHWTSEPAADLRDRIARVLLAVGELA
jgi:3-hydroxybutyryl-CoA dehydrogenase